MCIASKSRIVIAAIASSAYVKAAVDAGFDVVAIDAFIDIDTQRYAKQCYQVDVSGNQLDVRQLLNVLESLDLQQFVGFCYGAGLEQAPEVLKQIAMRIKVLGNAARVVEQCKSTEQFFKRCDELDVPYPLVKTSRPLHASGWIQKVVGGSGGTHIRLLEQEAETCQDSVYYQKIQDGIAISCLFLASEGVVQVIGFSEQWLDENTAEPFRYGGAVSHAEIDPQAKKRFTEYVSKLSQTIGLVGLNSCDAICDGEDVYVLEINPRLSATIALYAPALRHIMAMHVAACQNDLSGDDLLHINRKHEMRYAHQVVYAQQQVSALSVMDWPHWVSDVPQAGSDFGVGSPICTVSANAKTPLEAKRLVKARATELSSKFLN